MSTAVCSSCGTDADENYSVRHRGCGCMTHVECLIDQTRVGQQCAMHDGSGSGGTEPWPNVSGKSKAKGEPRPTDGIDYVLTPGKKQAPGMLSKVASYLPGMSKAPTQPTGAMLLKTHVPIDDIMKRHGLGLQHLLKEGIEMSDFLNNGYNWNDLLKFKDIASEGPERAFQTLVALNTRATHFRDYPKAFPIDAVRKHAEFDSKHLCISFGLTFPDDGPLECAGDQEWPASACVKLGLTIEDLLDFGLYYTQQYQDLFKNVPPKETAVLEKRLGTTIEHLEGLVDLEELIMREEEKKQTQVFAKERPAAAAVAAPAPVPVRAKQQQKTKRAPVVIEHQHEEEEEDEQQQPARQERVYRIPVSAPVQKQQPHQYEKIVHVTPAHRARDLRTPEQRAHDKFGRHGAILK
jgi:hypothetical protein